MTEATPKRGVLFVDVADSSRLLRDLGDAAAQELIQETLDRLASVVEARYGRVVSQIGDELLCVFGDVREMAIAALEMQRAVRELVARGQLAAPVSIRVGCHFGPLLERDGEVFGDTVYTANRMATLAKGDQILTTQATLELLGEGSPIPSRFVDSTTIRGKRGKFEVHELIWDAEGMTWAPGVPSAEPRSADHLEICYREDVIELGGERPVLTIGRGADCDLVVDEPSVSRHHARIEERKGAFALLDHSTNGCWLLLNGREWIQVHREERRLEGSGLIVLGPDRNGSAVLHYRMLDLDATIPSL